MKNQKKKKNKIDDKDTSDTPPAPYVPNVDTPNASVQDAGSTDSYLPYLLEIAINISKSPPTPKT